MIVNDSIADMLTHIRNNLRHRNHIAYYKPTLVNKKILNILHQEGFIRGYKESLDKKKMIILLIYKDGNSIIQELSCISKNSKQISASLKVLHKINNVFVLYILSTPKGILSQETAIKQKVGGKVLCRIK